MAEQQPTQLKKKTKEIKPRLLGPLHWEVFSSDQLLKADLPEQEFLVKHLIPKAAITMLSGNPGSGKSWFTLEIAKSVSSGFPLFWDESNDPDMMFRFDAKNTNVLYIDEESSRSEIQRRWKMLKPPYLCTINFMSMQEIKVDVAEKGEALLNAILAEGYGLVIFDSLVDFHSRDENNSQQTQLLIDYFRKLTKHGVTVFILHHNRKESYSSPNNAAQKLRGSTAIQAGVDCHLSIDKSWLANGVREIIISQPKLRQGREISPFRVTLTELDKFVVLEYGGELEEKENKIQQAKDKIIEVLEDGRKSNGELVAALKELDLSARTINSALKELTKVEKIERTEDGKHVFYSL